MLGETPMSFDPFAPGSDLPPEYGPAPMQPASSSDARSRVLAPAVGLIVVGVLNLFLAGGPAFYGFGVSKVPPAQLEEELRKQRPKALEDAEAQGWSVSDMRNLLVYGSFSLAGLDFLASFLVIFGGIRMLSLKNYGLAILAAILAALPGVSCSGCCGVGAIVGIWALVVLLNAEVRAAFQ
jgi:hypothetical protein